MQYINIMYRSNKRLVHDLEELQSDEFRSNGIYYWFDDSNIMKGRAMIIGPEGTPYEACPLIFDILLPPDYPLKNPSVQIVTSDGLTRLHPNLYVTGKVCLSILGTWKGPGWSPILSLGKVLLSIQSLLDANPITNEPGYELMRADDPVARGYAAIVSNRIIQMTYPALMNLDHACPTAWTEFKDVIGTLRGDLLERLKTTIMLQGDDKMYRGIPYGMSGETRWAALKELCSGTCVDEPPPLGEA
jgi:ubiquitin-protein ligase